MNKKMWLAGLIAAVIMFLWGFIAHDVLPTAEMSIRTTPGEDAVLAGITTNMNASGLYILPGEAMFKARSLPKEQQKAAMDQAQAKWMAGPRAIVIYSAGASPGFGLLLAREFFSTLFGAWVIAFAFVAALPRLRTFGHRVAFVTTLGLLPFLLVDVSLWNWYQFPPAYVVSEVLDYVVGAMLAGIFLAWFYRKEGGAQTSAVRA